MRELGPAVPSVEMRGLACGPAAFLRHGVIADPRDLDARGGELEDWTVDG